MVVKIMSHSLLNVFLYETFHFIVPSMLNVFQLLNLFGECDLYCFCLPCKIKLAHIPIIVTYFQNIWQKFYSKSNKLEDATPWMIRTMFRNYIHIKHHVNWHFDISRIFKFGLTNKIHLTVNLINQKMVT